MIKGIGTDLVEIGRILRALKRWPGVFDRRIFTPAELAYSYGQAVPEASLAARFAAKEAVMKALGTGWGRVRWCDVEVVATGDGRPSLVLHGLAREMAAGMGIAGWWITLSHTREHALAVAVAESA